MTMILEKERSVGRWQPDAPLESLEFDSVQLEKVWELRMDVLWEFVELEPCNLVKLVRLTIADFLSVNTNFEIKCYPVCGFSIVDTMNVPITEKFIIQNIRTILLLNFLTDGLVNGFAELQPATADVPSSVLIPGVVAAFCHNEFTFSVMTKVHQTNTDMIYSFYQIFSHDFILLSLRQNDLSFLMKNIKKIAERQLEIKKKLNEFPCPSVVIKKFSFLLSVKTWFEQIVFPGSLAVLKSRGEATPNSRGVARRLRRRNAFGLIQEYCTISEIARRRKPPRFARRPVCIEFSGQKRIGDFKKRKENFLIPNPTKL